MNQYLLFNPYSSLLSLPLGYSDINEVGRIGFIDAAFTQRKIAEIIYNY